MGAHTSAILDSLRRIVQTLRESARRAERDMGISGAQLFVLEKLAEAPSQSINELAVRTHTHQSSVSTVVARLVEHGLVARERSAGDARRLELVLTGRGRRMTARSPGAAQDRLLRTVEGLQPKARRQLASLLHQVVIGMDALEPRPRMFFDDERKRAHQRKRTFQKDA